MEAWEVATGSGSYDRLREAKSRARFVISRHIHSHHSRTSTIKHHQSPLILPSTFYLHALLFTVNLLMPLMALEGKLLVLLARLLDDRARGNHLA
eukprot:scaffold980_cov140-Skeletonema_menzelii.AAC.5